jgi:hypothetical protein
MSDLEKENTLNAFEFISGYISNEINNGKKKHEIVDNLVKNMNINRDTATKLVFKNDGFKDKMYYFSKNYIRKNLFQFIVISIISYLSIFILLSYLGEYDLYVQFSKYSLIIFFVSLIVSGIIVRESKKIFMNYINIVINTFISISSFILGSFLLFFMNWENIDLIDSLGTIKARFLVSIINFIIELGPQIIGSIFLIISLIFIGIAWKFYYDLTILKLDNK